MKNSSKILNIWSGAIYQETDINRIDTVVTEEDFKNMQQAARCYLVEYDNHIWSWKLFSSFPPEFGLGKIFVTEEMKEDPPYEISRYFNDAKQEDQSFWNTALTLVDIENKPNPIFFKDYQGRTENPSHFFMYRETFDNRCSIFRGGISLINFMDEVPIEWLNLFETHAPLINNLIKTKAPLIDKSESRYKGLFFEGEKDDPVIQNHSDTQSHSVSFTLYNLGLIIVKYCDAFKEMTKQGGNPPVLENVDKNLIKAMVNFKEEAEEYFLKYAFSMSKFNFENLNVDERTNVELAIHSALFQASFTEPDINHLMKTMGYNRKMSKYISYGNMVLKLFLEKYNLDINWEIIDKELKSY